MGLVLGNAEQLVVTVITAVASGGTVAAFLEWLQRRRETSGRIHVLPAEALWDRLIRALDEQQESVEAERRRVDELMAHIMAQLSDVSRRTTIIEEAVSGGNVDSVGDP